MYELDADTRAFALRAAYQMPDELIAAIQESRPGPDDDTILGQAARAATAIQVPDLVLETGQPMFDVLQRAGFRALLAVPLVREQRVVGVLVIRRKTPGDFPHMIVDLVQTFASQSVLAIENARLFQEIEEASRELEVASQHKSQLPGEHVPRAADAR